MFEIQCVDDCVNFDSPTSASIRASAITSIETCKVRPSLEWLKANVPGAYEKVIDYEKKRNDINSSWPFYTACIGGVYSDNAFDGILVKVDGGSEFKILTPFVEFVAIVAAEIAKEKL